jgi:TetR/AcrR family transcriptional repressor of mexCD-oprJ operon
MSDRRLPHKRADAMRNTEAILDAAAIQLSDDADATMADIASAAGVGRVTLYAHFPSRRDLVDATVARALAEGHVALDGVDLSGDPRGALCRLIASSWLLIAQIGSLMAAAQVELAPERMLELHEQPAARVEELVRRGQDEGVFRVDLPGSWLVALLHVTLHGAANEIREGRIIHTNAALVIASSVLAAWTAPGERVPEPAEWLSA